MKTYFLFLVMAAVLTACSSSPDRSPQQVNRAGRAYTTPKVMNRHPVDTNSLYQSCIKEREASYCNNRLGR